MGFSPINMSTVHNTTMCKWLHCCNHPCKLHAQVFKIFELCRYFV